jgi:DNA polymerase V
MSAYCWRPRTEVRLASSSPTLGALSCGLRSTKTLAKLANHVAKTAERKLGSYPAALAKACHFGEMPARELDEAMRVTAVGDVWGIGRKIGPGSTTAASAQS